MNFDKLFAELRSVTNKALELKKTIYSEQQNYDEVKNHSNWPNMDATTATRLVFLKGGIDSKIAEYQRNKTKFEEMKTIAFELLSNFDEGAQVSDTGNSGNEFVNPTITLRLVEGELNITGIKWPEL